MSSDSGTRPPGQPPRTAFDSQTATRPPGQPPQPALGPHDIIVLSREEKRFALGLGFA